MFEWDESKNEETRRRRGFGFELMEHFLWDYALCIDVQEHGKELRELWLGPIGSKVYAVVLTQRGDAIRVISLRYAEQFEIRRWRKEMDQ